MSEPKIINLLNKVDDDVSQIDSNVNQIYSDLSKIIEDINLISGTAEATHINNEYTAFLPNIPGLTLWLRVTIQTTNENTGPATLNINNSGPIPLKKSGGTDVKLKAGGIYTFVYDGVNFILQGEGGEGEYGTATAADVLAPKTIGTDDGIVTGTMPDLRGQTLSAGWYNTERKTTVQVNQPNQGMVDGYTQYEVDMPTLVSSNIKSGVKIFGVDGAPNVVDTTIASTRAAAAVHISAGRDAFVNGIKVVGAAPPPMAYIELTYFEQRTVAAGDIRSVIYTLPTTPGMRFITFGSYNEPANPSQTTSRDVRTQSYANRVDSRVQVRFSIQDSSGRGPIFMEDTGSYNSQDPVKSWLTSFVCDFEQNRIYVNGIAKDYNWLPVDKTSLRVLCDFASSAVPASTNPSVASLFGVLSWG